MKITYDQKYNVAYILFREKEDNIETLKISEDLNIDISTDGKLYGIELLNANEQLDLMTGEDVILFNEETKEERRISVGKDALGIK